MKKNNNGYYRITETLEIDGIKKRYQFYGKTKAEAQRKRDEFIYAQDPTNFTFNDVYQRYKVMEQSRIKEADYKTKCERIESFTSIMYAKLDAITPQMIAIDLNRIAVENPKTKKTTAKRTLARYIQAVSNVFDYAEENRYSTYNPCKYVKPPTDAPQIKREALLPEEYKSILNNPEPCLFQAKLLILTGLRKGEAAALQYMDILDDATIINVNKSFDYKTNKVKLPKTQAGIRQVPIPSMIQDELRKRIAEHKPDDYVFEKYTGGQHSLNSWIKYVNKCNKKTGITFTLHQLRHTCCTIYYYSGIDVKEAQAYMGHSNVRITLDIYTSLENSDRIKNNSISKMDKFLA